MTKLYKSYQFMWRRYVVQKKTERQIADEIGADQATVHRWLVRHGIIK